jgi:hypothetical protein
MAESPDGLKISVVIIAQNIAPVNEGRHAPALCALRDHP